MVWWKKHVLAQRTGNDHLLSSIWLQNTNCDKNTPNGDTLSREGLRENAILSIYDPPSQCCGLWSLNLNFCDILTLLRKFCNYQHEIGWKDQLMTGGEAPLQQLFTITVKHLRQTIQFGVKIFSRLYPLCRATFPFVE